MYKLPSTQPSPAAHDVATAHDSAAPRRARATPAPRTRTIGASDFKARCLALLDEVASTHCEIVVTKRGKPVAVVRSAVPSAESEIGSWKGLVRLERDIVRSGPADDWNVVRETRKRR